MVHKLAPLHIELAPSRRLAGALAAAYCVAAAMVLSASLARVAALAILALLIVCAWRALAHAMNPPPARTVRRLVLDEERDWVLVTRAGRVLSGRPVGLALVHPWAVAFTLQLSNGERRRVLVLPDTTDARSFHALRLWFRLHAKRAAVQGRRADAAS